MEITTMTAFLLSNVPFPGQSGDRIVSKAITQAISALFKKTGNLEANVKAEPVAKLLQGSIDGFDFIGNGLLMYNGLRIEAMELYLQAVSIDFSAIFTGKIKLRKSTQATMRVVLTENDLTTSFNTPFIVEKLQKLQYEDQPLHFEKTQMIINDDKSLQIKSKIRIGKAKEPIEIDIKATLNLEDRRKIKFIDVFYEGNEQAKLLGKALIDHVNNLLDLDKFALDGTKLAVDQIRIANKQILFYGTALIEHFPHR